MTGLETIPPFVIILGFIVLGAFGVLLLPTEDPKKRWEKAHWMSEHPWHVLFGGFVGWYVLYLLWRLVSLI
ncbi:hypothetical protein ACFL3S_02510 [Gemmatimonadota bacterium]